jgi:hypothetical protein
LKYVRGIIFFSTPHFGTDAFLEIINKLLKKNIYFFKIMETEITELSLKDEDLLEKLSEIEFSKPANEIMTKSREEFEKEHKIFRNLNIPYICLYESDKTYIKEIGEKIHIVKPESSFLPETENYPLEKKIHSTIHKFSPNNFDEKGYRTITDYIKNKFNLI